MMNTTPWLQDVPQGLRDLYTRLEVPLDPHWDVVDPNRPVRPMKDVVAAKIVPCVVPGMEKAQEVIDGHVMPRFMQMFQWFKEELKCGTYHLQPPVYQVPSATALCLDEFTDPPVPIFDTAPTVIIDFTIPDRFFAVIDRTGMALQEIGIPPLASFGDVVFQVLVNNAPIACMGEFTSQLGEFNNPSKLGAPRILKHLDHVQVTARLIPLAPPHLVWFRLQGWQIAAKEVTDDGTFTKFHLT